MTPSAVNLFPFTLLIAPISLFCLMLALKRRKEWLIRASLVGLVLTAVLLVIFQYLDYKHFEVCLLEGMEHNQNMRNCIKIR